MIKVRLSGGLGNQLFQYFEGARKSLESGEKLVLDFAEVYLGKSKHSSLISSFHFPVAANCVNVNPRQVTIWRRKIFLSIRFRILKAIKRSPQYLHIDAIRSQTCKNFEYVASMTQFEMDLINPSTWYRSLASQLNGAPFIAMHIRRGDYLLPRNRNSIGVLDKTYYEKCLNLAYDEVGKLPIFVFSDSDEISSEFMTCLPANTNYVHPPTGADPAESIALMSLAKVLVISNSTFSWWAAGISKESTIVYCPETWFKNLEQPRDLFRKSWNLVESEWVDYGDE